MAEQLTLDLPVRAARGREDFFVSPANAVALAQLDDWRNWPQNKLVLVGPEGAGKTHLAHVWATATGARIVPANALAQTEIPDLAGAVVVEDADQIAGQAEAENALFHLHNLVLAEGGHLLLTARSAPHYWATALPDLRSRMEATATATVNAPDDALLTALLIKLFSDRQLPVSAKLIAYLLPRIDRSFAAAADIVAKLDQAALASGRKISEKLAGELL
ncbi:P-loop NTPase family protein [Actibacterium pelagium]|uniref:DnaA protein n=1 Tax=Actibacterium pelagium TaxID=2029103 RepID=A0A917EKI9_9RHOB|nr:DnaA/Hda family protein [Actibacterium pelagium]GGE49282.1 hypothetical protein GCM10011517_16380 [Actibacterium pelagium]